MKPIPSSKNQMLLLILLVLCSPCSSSSVVTKSDAIPSWLSAAEAKEQSFYSTLNSRPSEEQRSKVAIIPVGKNRDDSLSFFIGDIIELIYSIRAAQVAD